MHSYDRTLLAKLGFQDPDRRLPLHDFACAYVGEHALEVVDAVYPRQVLQDQEGVEIDIRREVRHKLEVPIRKGEGKYKTTVGFLDVLFEWHQLEKCTWSGFNPETQSYEENVPGTCDELRRIGVEVKVSDVPVGDVLRQINLYREYVEFYSFFLITTHRYSRREILILANNSIRCVLLTNRFQDWVRSQNDQSDQTLTEF